MKLLKLYSFFTGSMSEFVKPFSDNKALYNQARSFWNGLEKISIFIVLICILFSVSCVFFYYTKYNNMPGRHYTPKHWFYWMIGAFLATLLLTLGFEYIAVEPKIPGALLLEFKIALGNAIYALIIYFVLSVIWCNTLPTNAYKRFKF